MDLSTTHLATWTGACCTASIVTHGEPRSTADRHTRCPACGHTATLKRTGHQTGDPTSPSPVIGGRPNSDRSTSQIGAIRKSIRATLAP